MKTKKLLTVFAGTLSLIAYVPYVISILNGQTKPAKASWIIWAIMDTVLLAGMYAKKAVNGQILGATTGALAVAILALQYGIPGWSKLDFICLSGAVLGIFLWKIFNNPTLGIIASLIVLTIGTIPTLVSVYQDPSRENNLAWTLVWLGSICAVAAIPKKTIADAAQPIVFLTLQTIIIYLLYFHVGG